MYGEVALSQAGENLARRNGSFQSNDGKRLEVIVERCCCSMTLPRAIDAAYLADIARFSVVPVVIAAKFRPSICGKQCSHYLLNKVSARRNLLRREAAAEDRQNSFAIVKLSFKMYLGSESR